MIGPALPGTCLVEGVNELVTQPASLVASRPAAPAADSLPWRFEPPAGAGHRLLAGRWFAFLQVAGAGLLTMQKVLAGNSGPIYVLLHVACYFVITSGLHVIYRHVFAQRRAPAIDIVTIIAFSLLGGLTFVLINDLAIAAAGLPMVISKADLTYTENVILTSLTHFKSVTLLVWSALYLGLLYWQDSEEERRLLVEARAESDQAQLNMLRNQLSPHFLFNALNSIATLIRQDPRRAEQVVDELSEFLRYALVSTRESEGTLEEEVNVLRRYLSIQQVRFEEKLLVAWDVDPRALDRRVPAFLLHPLVENAIKYGMQTSELPLRISIAVRELAGRVQISVANSGRLQAARSLNGPMQGAGLGLEIVRRRLAQRFPETHRFSLAERDGQVHAVVDLL